MKRFIPSFFVLLFSILLPFGAYSQSQNETQSTIKGRYKTIQGPSKNSGSAGLINGHEAVDLGLSVRWATCNVGSSKPSDYGNYYAWGETSTKNTFEIGNYPLWKKKMTDIRGTKYDVAHTDWGGSWRLPTFAECKELRDKCEWEWTTEGGHQGYKVTGPNGNSIFLPAAGYNYGNSPDYMGSSGHYWSSTPTSNDFDSWSIDFDNGVDVYYGRRYGGRSVRPVIGYQEDNIKEERTSLERHPNKDNVKINGHEAADLGLSVKWATCNVGASKPSDYGNLYGRVYEQIK